MANDDEITRISDVDGNDENERPKSSHGISLTKKPNAFISYCLSQQKLVHKVRDHLKDSGDFGEISIDEKKPVKKIDSSEVVIVCASEDYKRDAQCRREIEYSSDHRGQKLLLPLKMTEMKFDGPVGMSLAGKVYVDMTEISEKPEDEPKLLEKLNEIKEIIYDELQKRDPDVIEIRYDHKTEQDDGKRRIPIEYTKLEFCCHTMRRRCCCRACGNQIWGRVLISIMILVALCGIALVSGGTWFLATNLRLYAPALAVVAIGCLLTMFSIFTCLASWRDNCCCVTLCAVIPLIGLMTASLTLSLTFLLKSEEIKREVQLIMENLVETDDPQGIMAALSEKFKCCGVTPMLTCPRSYTSICQIGSAECQNACLPAVWDTGHRFIRLLAICLFALAGLLLLGIFAAICRSIETTESKRICPCYNTAKTAVVPNV